MRRGTTEAFEARLETARRAVAAWRVQRRRGTRMPEGLWAEAVSLAAEVGVSPVARILEVGHKTLGERLLERSRPAGMPSRSGEVTFVEVTGAPLAGVMTASSGTTDPVGSVVELRSRDGSQMVVRLGAKARLDVVGLVHAFWGMGR